MHQNNYMLSLNCVLCYLCAQGSWRGDIGAVMDNNAVHAVADGGDARDGAGEEVRQVP